MNVIEAVIFDMDGVLIDSEEFIRKASVELYRQKGYTVTEDDFIPFTGMGENRFIGGVAEKYGIQLDDIEIEKKRVYAIYDDLVRGKLPPLDGTLEFIQKCRDRGLKLAVATSADIPKVVINLREIGLTTETFDACVTGNDVTHKKPDPEIFLTASAGIGVAPEHCLVVEDAVSGVEAAKASGARCLAVTTSFPAERLAKADWIAANLAHAPDDVLNW
ncbi:MAG: HAD-IA family hydrolase [bacterium]|nr:HAD-IA family hydrolase [bacterium]